MTIVVTEMQQEDRPAWDSFVLAHADGTFCHRAGWKQVVEKGAGQRCPFMLARESGEIVGVLPLSIKKHPLFGRALVSTMFCVYGGVLAKSEKAAEALVEAAWQLAERQKLPILELRSLKGRFKKADGWTGASQSATFIGDLAASDEAQLLAIPRKQRAVVRKSLKNDLVTDWQGDLDTFYDLYAQNVLTHGTPVFPKKLFAELLTTFGSDVEIQITRTSSGETVAGLMSFYHNGTVMPYYAGGTQAARPLAAHDHMYFQLMLHARERGCRRFDFGRSRIDSGPYRFKKNWGFTPRVLEYEYRLAPGEKAPNMSQQSGAFATLSKIWTKLPLPLSKLLGPPLARHLG